MRIAIDIQGYQSEESSLRGIGRYSIALIKSLISTFPNNQYILVANTTLKDVRDDFNDELTNSNFNVSYYQWYSVGPRNQDLSDSNYFRLAAIQLRTYALKIINADCILITSHFEGFLDNCLTDIDTNNQLPPIISIIYDLIPLINSGSYLDGNPFFKKFYYMKLNQIESYDGLLAISNSSMQEANKYLRIDPSSIFNISSACDKKIFCRDQEITINSDSMINNFGEFLLYSGAGDPRKNLQGLIKAYSNIPINLRKKYKLVLAGKLFDSEINLLEKCIEECDLKRNQIIILGYVSDEFLVTLYRKCKLFIFPSLHEGFGLPVLEAMCCGAPVISSNSSSLPEIVGIKEAMFNPLDISSMTNLIKRSLTDHEFYNRLIKNSITKSNLFSWKSTTEKLFKSIEIIIQNRIHSEVIDNISPYQILIDNLRNIFNQTNIQKIENDILIKQIASAITLIDDQAKQYYKCNLDFSKDLKWKIEGPIDSNYSLAILNRNFTEAMSHKEIDIYINCTDGPGDYNPDLSFLSGYKRILDIHKREQVKCDISSRNLYPPRVDDFDGQLKLLHAYGWEETEFPSEWVDNFNKHLDGISVMSSFVKNLLINNGVSIPIKVCGLGIEHIYHSVPEKNFTVNSKKYNFLHVSSCFPRKGIIHLLKAFGQAFNKYDDVSLIIKTSHNPHNNIFKILNQVKSDNPNYPHVVVLDQDFSDSRMKALYQYSDALIAPSLGEGFGLPIAEAMLLDLPVITTDWSGQLDFCNSENSWLIDFEYKYSKTHFNLVSSVWAQPLVEKIVDRMLEVYNSTNEELRSKIEKARSNIQKFTWDSVAEINLDFAKKLTTFDYSRSTRIGWITTWNSRCGIASYSKHLVDFISDKVTIFAPKEETHIHDENNVIRCWDLDDKFVQDLDIMLNEILNKKITTAIIQFNYGFFNFKALSKFINNLSSNDIRIIIYLHSTIDPNDNSDKSLINIRDSLAKCDRILVHTPRDLNRLKDIGLGFNSFIFPHGVLDFDQSNYTSSNLLSSLSNNNKVCIASYGFCLPNKGFLELIHAVKILKSMNYNIDLTLYTAIHSAKISTQYFDELNDQINLLELGKCLKIDSCYYTDSETLINLSKQDLIVFPYQSSNESSSASVRHGLAAGPNVLVTPIPIFDDLQNVVHNLPGISAQDIAEGIHNWLQKSKSIKSINSNLQVKANNWRKQHRFSLLGRRLQGLVRGLELNKKVF